MNPLTEIISKLEKATGPDRELDCRIYGLENNLVPAQTWCVGDSFQFKHPTDPSKAVYIRDAAETVPWYTQSIDAAITLAPTHFEWLIREDKEHGEFFANLSSGKQYTSTWLAYPTRARHPAIALCIAALRSRGEQ